MNLIIDVFGNAICESVNEIEFVGNGYFKTEFYSSLYNHPQYWLYYKTGGIIGKTSYRFIKHFKNDKAVVSTLDYKMHLIDKKGQNLFTFNDDTYDVYSINNKFFTVRTKDNKYYVLDNEYKEILNTNDAKIGPVYDEIIVLEKNSKQGLIDIKGNILVDAIFDRICDYMGKLFRYDNLIIVSNNNKYGCIDIKGNIIIPIEYDSIYYPYEKHIYVEKDNSILLLNYDGSVFLKGDFSDLVNYDNGIIVAKYNSGKYVILNEKREAISKEHDYIFMPKYNKDENKVIPNWFYYREKNKYGIMSSNGHIILEANYDKVLSYNQQYIILRNKTGDYILNARNELINIEEQYDSYGIFSDNRCSVEKDHMYGFIDENGKIIIDVQYSYVCSDFNNYLCLVSKDKN